METKTVQLYNIVRFYRSEQRSSRIIRRNVTLEEAQEHCQQPYTRGRDAYGISWLDGYEKVR